MRNMLIGIILLVSTICSAQRDSTRSLNIKLKSLRYGSLFISGAAKGTADAISFHYDSFQRVHPNANPQICNPAISWTNKYSYGDPRQGERYLGSKTFLVWTTDLWHGLNAVTTVTGVGGTIIIVIGEKKSWKYYLKELGLGYLANRAGFHLTYNLIYK